MYVYVCVCMLMYDTYIYMIQFVMYKGEGKDKTSILSDIIHSANIHLRCENVEDGSSE